MLLTGTFIRSLDDKQRLAIPKPIRDTLQGPAATVFYVAPGTDGSLAIYPESAFNRLAGQLDAASPVGPDVRAFSRLFYAQAQRVEIDKQGRLRIPAELMPAEMGEQEVVLIGVRDHLELWDRHQWESYLDDKQPQYDEIAESAFSPRLSPSMTNPPQGPATTTTKTRPR